ncbi:MAG: RcnB family protein [Brevundimonas sp.]|nr:RcnB family protein [Brevundimonas sp.]
MKRTLIVAVGVAAFAVPALAPLSVLAQDGERRGDRRGAVQQNGGEERRAARPDRPSRSENLGGGEARPERPSRPAQPDRPQSRPDGPVRPDASSGGNRTDRPQGRPDRPSRPDANSGGARPDRPEARPDRSGQPRSRSDRPTQPQTRPDQFGGNTGAAGTSRPQERWDGRGDRRGDRRDDRQDRRGDRSERREDRREYREFRQRFNSDQWRRNWNRTNRGDWWRSDRRFRGYTGLRIGFYFAPGYGYYQVPRNYWGQRYHVGQYLPSIFWRYQLNDWRTYGLGYPPPGTQWVLVDNHIYLIDQYDGYIIDVIFDAWRW